MKNLYTMRRSPGFFPEDSREELFPLYSYMNLLQSPTHKKISHSNNPSKNKIHSQHYLVLEKCEEGTHEIVRDSNLFTLLKITN